MRRMGCVSYKNTLESHLLSRAVKNTLNIFGDMLETKLLVFFFNIHLDTYYTSTPYPSAHYIDTFL